MLKEASPEYHSAPNLEEANTLPEISPASPEAVAAAKAEVLALKEQIDKFQLQLDFLQTELDRVTPKNEETTEPAEGADLVGNAVEISRFSKSDPTITAREDVRRAFADIVDEIDASQPEVQDTPEHQPSDDGEVLDGELIDDDEVTTETPLDTVDVDPIDNWKDSSITESTGDIDPKAKGEEALAEKILSDPEIVSIADLIDNISKLRKELQTSDNADLKSKLVKFENDYTEKMDIYRDSKSPNFDARAYMYLRKRYEAIPAVNIQDTSTLVEPKQDTVPEEEKLKSQTTVNDLNKLADAIVARKRKLENADDTDKDKLQKDFDRTVAGFDEIMVEYQALDLYDEEEAEKITQRLRDGLDNMQTRSQDDEPQTGVVAPGAKQLLETLAAERKEKLAKSKSDAERKFSLFDWTDNPKQGNRNLKAKFDAAFRSKEARKGTFIRARNRAIGATATLGSSIWNNLLLQTGKNGTRTLKDQERARQAAEAKAAAEAKS